MRNDELTPRQRQILRLMATGMTDPEIGAQLHIASRTVRSHNNVMFSKMGVRNRTEAVVMALKLGLVGIDGVTG